MTTEYTLTQDEVKEAVVDYVNRKGTYDIGYTAAFVRENEVECQIVLVYED